jgi:acetoin:2,6-dichlorophenolindophenol oxidoreductase subunit alpha
MTAAATQALASHADERLTGRPDEPRDARLYRRMRFIRRFEETLLALFEEGVLNGTTHACIGQEADAVAVMEQLADGDHVFSNHRCHGHFLARTGDAFGLLAEIMGKPAGLCAGIGGSQHICAPGFKSNGVQGGIVPAAAGIALAAQLTGSDALSVVFIGDGTLGEGVVYETLNVTSLWQLPLLIVVEDNGWSQSTPRSVNLAGDIAARFRAFDLPVTELDTTDVLELEQAAAAVVSGCRARRGPGVLVIHTYRLCHHSKNDDNRPVEEVEARWELDPLAIHGARLGADERSEVDREIEDALADCVAGVRQL